MRARLVLGNVVILLIVLLGTSAYFISRHKVDVVAENDARAATMRSSVHSKGARRVRILAATARNVIAAAKPGHAPDLPFVAEVMRETVANDRDTLYSILMDAERRAVIHTNSEAQGQILSDRATLFASASDAVPGEIIVDNVLDTSAPVMVNGQRWGTIRFGVSLAPLDQDMCRARCCRNTKRDVSLDREERADPAYQARQVTITARRCI